MSHTHTYEYICSYTLQLYIHTYTHVYIYIYVYIYNIYACLSCLDITVDGRSGTSKEYIDNVLLLALVVDTPLGHLGPDNPSQISSLMEYEDLGITLVNERNFAEANLWVAESFQSLFDPLLSLWVIVLGSEDRSWRKFRSYSQVAYGCLWAHRCWVAVLQSELRNEW